MNDYINVFIHPNRLPISLVHELMGDKERLTDEKTLKTINTQIVDFINF